MASRRPRPRRFLVPTVLAAVLAAEITGLALARTLAPAAAPNASPVQNVSPAAVAAATVARTTLTDASRDTIAPLANLRRTRADVAATPPAVGPASPVRAAAVSATPRAAGGSGGHASSPSYHGRNHVWIPSLGITKTVQSFPCSRTRPPDAGVYRWGCAGRNNVFLLAHAWSTFKPLHDAYVGGRLHKGMKVVYADGAGRVHTYAVIWWRVTAPTTAAAWAWASLSRPSLTLQTCVGANSQYRLMVRLVRTA